MHNELKEPGNVSSTSAIEIFFCYAREDRALLQKLRKHLRPLERDNLIVIWSDTDIDAGREWEQEIEKHLNTAHLILLLISPDFMNSEYCYSKEMARAMERHEQNEARVIPVILRPTSFWERAPFGRLQAIPLNAKPITLWLNEDDAFSNAAEYIENVRTKQQEIRIEQLLKRLEQFLDTKHYTEALQSCNDLINLEPDYAVAHMKKGQTLFQLRRFEEAKRSYEAAIAIDPKNEIGHLQKGNCLIELQQYNEALNTFEKFILLWNNEGSHTIRKDVDPYFYYGKGKALLFLQKYEQALEAINQGIILMGSDVDSKFYQDQGSIYQHLAEQAYERAKQVPNDEGNKTSLFSIENHLSIENGVSIQKHRLSKGQKTHDKAYYQPILQALVDLDGSAKSHKVLIKIEFYMRSILKPVDYEPLSSDPKSPRWRNTAQWVRYTMVQEGLLKPDSPRGIWEITETGREFLRKHSIR